jgi:hypothetical protein
LCLISNIAALADRTDKWLKKNWPEFVEYSRQVHLAGQAILDAVATVPGTTGPKGFPPKDLFVMIGEQGGIAGSCQSPPRSEPRVHARAQKDQSADRAGLNEVPDFSTTSKMSCEGT